MLSKIVSLEELLPALAGHRESAEQIVFTNGCFDLIHLGHVTYLAAARRLGDRLVVGLNADVSVRRIKGPRRPIVPQDQRAAVLAHLACVDYVTLFSNPDPGELVRALKPDILVKGADWEEDDIVGAEMVKQYGGRVERIPVIANISTSGIIRKIVTRYGSPA